MGYKNILVHLDNSRACGKRVEAALDLARRYDAHLVGLYFSLEVSVPSYIQTQLSEEVRELQRRSRQEMADSAVNLFEETAKRAGYSTVESRVHRTLLEDVPQALALHGRYSDLLVLGQHDPDDEDSFPSSALELSLLSVGRPVLVVPYIGAGKDFGKRIMLAWQSSRESARAASDALPLLKRAESVLIVCVNPKQGIGGHGDQPGADIALSLARHGVKAEAQHVVSPDIDVADTILSRASDHDVDMIVMGAYGHSRVRELVLGGVTQHMLEHMTVPVLMSH